ncbi:MAG: cytochrome c-type biogenesis protein CcmH [Chloroflexi bacterium]|nr:cytochrome c-type biogenesis protein CcmH [Chloroflexota bacterium]
MRTKTIFLLTFYFLLFASALLPAVAASAQQPTPSDDEVNAIARQLYCPVCENTPLDVCPTTACHQWRELIRQMLAEGKSEADIKQYFVDYYGARVLSEPPRTGINWLVYVVPPLAFLAGVTLLFRAFTTWKRLAKEPITGADQSSSPGSGSEPADGSGTAVDDEYFARLEEELKKRK